METTRALTSLNSRLIDYEPGALHTAPRHPSCHLLRETVKSVTLWFG